MKNKARARRSIARYVGVLALSFALFISVAWISVDALLLGGSRKNYAISVEGQRDFKNSDTLSVPELRGKIYTGESMANVGAAKDFSVVSVREEENDSPKGTIIDQTPAPSAKRKRNASKPHVIEVTVSAGARMLTLPNVLGKDVRVARIELEDAGFSVAVKEEKHFHATENSGKVTRSVPPSGTAVKASDTVVLYVCAKDGAVSVKCPDLEGMCRLDAVSTLHAHGLKAGVIDKPYGSESFSAKVTSQSRLAGTYLPRGSTVDIVLTQDTLPHPWLEFGDNNINDKLFFKQEVEKDKKFWRERSFRWHITRQDE
ncbi:MAG: PASTA domain-containing protein [Ruminococcaceae bacterium]|nr:PASTA domain-containing protein [Oscillospiraceae bacterium]